MPWQSYWSLRINSSGIRLNRSGLELAPCLTPWWILKGFAMRPLRIKLDVSVLYIAFSSPSTCGSNPDCLSRSKIISLPMLSKAFCMSNRHMCSSCPLSFRIYESNSSVRIYSVQFLPFLKPAYSSESKFFDSRWVRSFFVISLSMILSHTFVSDIGLCA